MPIKFRCNYCRQFLGISRNRAGGVVDCPTCGRTIRVPELDGSLAPVPAPGLNSDDEHLARALDELGALAQIDLQALPAAEDLEEPDDEIPQPLPEPVPMEIPIPITPAVVSLDLPSVPAISTAPPGPSVDVLAELAAASPREFVTAQPAPQTTIGHPRWLLIAAFAPLLTLLVGLGLGWTIGRLSSHSADAPLTPAEKNVIADASARVRGRISYQTPEGTIEPDVGAAVLLLPESWDAVNRLAPAGLRPADAVLDQEFVAVAITGMQGRLGFANAAGEFDLSASTEGKQRVLVLSRLSARPEGTAIAPEDLTLLQGYLQDPEATLGQRSYVLKTVEVREGAETVWDHQFAAE